MGMTFYSIDDRILLRKAGPGHIPERYAGDGWEYWTNAERFGNEAEEITEEQARAMVDEIKQRHREKDKAI